MRVFHFSSHGTQVDDQSDEEWECLDEVIVPYDHDWDNPFRDDDLRAIFEKIPEGVAFTFVADCCHSGTIQKGLFDTGIKFLPRYDSTGRDPRSYRSQGSARCQLRRLGSREAAGDVASDSPAQWASKMPGVPEAIARQFSPE